MDTFVVWLNLIITKFHVLFSNSNGAILKIKFLKNVFFQRKMTKLHKWSFIGFIQVQTSEKKYKHQEISEMFCTHWTIDVLEFAPPSANNGTIYAFHNLIFYEYNIDTIVTVAFVYIWLIRYLLDIYYFTRLKFTFHFRCVNYRKRWPTWIRTL